MAGHTGKRAEIDDLTLAALLSSRICHDLVGPIGALNNGVEIISDGADADLRNHAMDLVGGSAKEARARLEYYRAAFGAGGSLGDSAHPSEVRQMTEDFLDSRRYTLDWEQSEDSIARPHVRLLLNLILVGIEALPRGGLLRVGVMHRKTTNIIVMSEGRSARLGPRVKTLITDGVPADDAPLEPKEAPLLLINRLARNLGGEISFGEEEDRVVVAATL